MRGSEIVVSNKISCDALETCLILKSGGNTQKESTHVACASWSWALWQKARVTEFPLPRSALGEFGTHHQGFASQSFNGR